MKKNKSLTLCLTQGAMIASLYVVLTLLSSVFGLAGNNPVQIRFSEALTVLPAFTVAAVPGLFVGCIISNILVGGAIWDIVFGSLATLIGAAVTYKIGRHRLLAPIPPIVANILIVPFVLAYLYGNEHGIPFFMLTVGIGEIISCGVLGILVYALAEKHYDRIFKR